MIFVKRFFFSLTSPAKTNRSFGLGDFKTSCCHSCPVCGEKVGGVAAFAEVAANDAGGEHDTGGNESST